MCSPHSYSYDTVIQALQNDSVNIAACVDPLKTLEVPEIQIEPAIEDHKGETVGPSSVFLQKSQSFKVLYIHLQLRSAVNCVISVPFGAGLFVQLYLVGVVQLGE